MLTHFGKNIRTAYYTSPNISLLIWDMQKVVTLDMKDNPHLDRAIIGWWRRVCLFDGLDESWEQINASLDKKQKWTDIYI